MFLITIGTIYDKENIKDYIINRFNCLKKQGFDISYEENEIGNTKYINCLLNDNLLSTLFDKSLYKELNYQISELLADIIINNYEEKIIKKIIKSKYFYLSDKEKKYIKNLAGQMLMEQDTGILQGGVYKATRKNLVMRSALDYLSLNSTIIIDGFVNFRLKSYIKEIEETINNSFEVFITEREYKEFIKLLKYFVDIQESKLDIIHIKPTSDKNYILLDSNQKYINNEYFDELKTEIIDDDINHDDILISTLITLAPKKLIIHDIERFQNKELIKTITSVFLDKVIICSGCELCDIIKADKEVTKI